MKIGASIAVLWLACFATILLALHWWAPWAWQAMSSS